MYCASLNKIEKTEFNKDSNLYFVDQEPGCEYWSSLNFHYKPYYYKGYFDCIELSKLLSNDCVTAISEYFEVDVETAEDILTGNINELEYVNDYGWLEWLEEIRVKCAVAMGYDGYKDSLGSINVYVVPIHGRETELSLVPYRCEHDT